MTLREYVRAAWPVLEPATTFVPGWHIDAICDHLEAVSRGELRRLIINVPPRHMKSLLVSVLWPTWTWTQRPQVRFLTASYAQPLATRDAVKSRRLIQSPWYQQHWGSVYQLTGDQNEKMRYENNKTGYRIATSVGGVATGEGGDVLILDDPHKADEVHSDLQRQSDLDWLRETWSTRLNDPQASAEVIIMQRLHEQDATGYLLQEIGGYEHLVLPAEFEPERACATVTGFTDPRLVEGDLLWPERFGQVELDDLKLRLGDYGAAGQLQQRPAPSAGGIFKVEWFDQRYDGAPRPQHIVQSWDTAFKDKAGSSWTVGTTWGITPSAYLLLHVWRHRVEYPDVRSAIRAQAAEWQPAAILVEDKASGQAVVPDLARETRLPLVPVQVTAGDKVVRARLVSPLVQAGKVVLPRSAPWLDAYLEELRNFPNSRFDDQVDSTTQFLDYARNLQSDTDTRLGNTDQAQGATSFGGFREADL
jgi:predicted phage terminase large subunit-like protein